LSGVPQGSVLGPILFLIFIDDLDEGLSSAILKFADDTKIYGRVDCWEDRNRLQRDLERLVDWADRWQMSFNVGKCKVMHLGGHNLEWNYVMSQQRLKVVREERDLGVVLRDDLKVSGNCQQAYAKASRMLGLMARTVRYRSLEVMVRLYKSLVRPHLEYCASAWSPHYVKDGELLERVQRRFSRMVPGLRGLEYEERLERLGLLTLGERRNRADLIELFRISKGLSAISLESFFELDTSGRTRGHSLKLRRRRFQTDTRKFFFSQRVINRWNALDEEVVTAGNVEVFKERLRKFCMKKKGCLKDQL
jgi:ribonuclease P/MRP protein subunit RPP40